MSAAGQIANKDLRLRLRDRSAIIIGVVAPLALAFIFHLVFGGLLSEESLDLQYGIVDLDDSDISRSFSEILAQLEDDEVLAVTTYEDAGSAEAAIEEGDIAAFVLLQPGLEEAAVSSTEYTIDVVGDIDSPTATQILSSIADQFGSGIGRAQLGVTTAIGLLGGPPPADVVTWGEEAVQQPRSYTLEDISAETRQLDATTFFAAGMAVFFLFFTVQFGVVGLLEEDQDGTLTRLRAAPIGRGSIVAGKALLSFALGVISMMILVVATHFLMGAVWGPPLGVALLVGSGVLAATSIIGLVAAIAKTAEGAGNLASIIAVTLGLLGGTFFPLGQGDDFLSKLSYLTPHAWFMSGLAAISGGAEWTAALPAVGALLLFAVVFGGVGWVLLNRRLTR